MFAESVRRIVGSMAEQATPAAEQGRGVVSITPDWLAPGWAALSDNSEQMAYVHDGRVHMSGFVVWNGGWREPPGPIFAAGRMPEWMRPAAPQSITVYPDPAVGEGWPCGSVLSPDGSWTLTSFTVSKDFPWGVHFFTIDLASYSWPVANPPAYDPPTDLSQEQPGFDGDYAGLIGLSLHGNVVHLSGAPVALKDGPRNLLATNMPNGGADLKYQPATIGEQATAFVMTVPFGEAWATVYPLRSPTAMVLFTSTTARDSSGLDLQEEWWSPSGDPGGGTWPPSDPGGHWRGLGLPGDGTLPSALGPLRVAGFGSTIELAVMGDPDAGRPEAGATPTHAIIEAVPGEVPFHEDESGTDYTGIFVAGPNSYIRVGVYEEAADALAPLSRFRRRIWLYEDGVETLLATSPKGNTARAIVFVSFYLDDGDVKIRIRATYSTNEFIEVDRVVDPAAWGTGSGVVGLEAGLWSYPFTPMDWFHYRQTTDYWPDVKGSALDLNGLAYIAEVVSTAAVGEAASGVRARPDAIVGNAA